MKTIFSILCLSICAFAQQSDWSGVAKILGRNGTEQAGTYKVSFARTDLHVKLGETSVEPGAALGSWMAFRREGNSVTTDGDLVLTPDELAKVVADLRDAGLTVSAIHNHLAGEEPEVMYVHFFGNGTAQSLATALHKALAETKTPQGAATKPEPQPLADQSAIETILGKKGTVNGKVLALSFPRPHPIRMDGHELDPAMGMATAINFQPSPQGVAATGDFVLRESETQAVLSALSAAHIRVTAMHNHLLEDDPRMVFIHFWAEGKAEQVARGLQSALDAAGR